MLPVWYNIIVNLTLSVMRCVKGANNKCCSQERERICFRRKVKRYTGIFILYSENFLDFFFVNACADYAESADYTGCATTDVNTAGNVVKVKPLTAFTLNNALCTKNHTEVAPFVKRLKNLGKLFPAEFLGGFCANRSEYIVCVVVMVVVVTTAVTMLVVVVVVMLVVVTTAIAMLVVVVVVMLVLVTTTVAMLVVVAPTSAA